MLNVKVLTHSPVARTLEESYPLQQTQERPAMSNINSPKNPLDLLKKLSERDLKKEEKVESLPLGLPAEPQPSKTSREVRKEPLEGSEAQKLTEGEEPKEPQRKQDYGPRARMGRTHARYGPKARNSHFDHAPDVDGGKASPVLGRYDADDLKRSERKDYKKHINPSRGKDRKYLPKDEMCEQAARVIKKFGSPYKLAKAMKEVLPKHEQRNASSIYRWLYPTHQGGTGGVIPDDAMPLVLKCARLWGVFIEESDLYVPENFTQVQQEAERERAKLYKQEQKEKIFGLLDEENRKAEEREE
jgi:hypothetical protein